MKRSNADKLTNIAFYVCSAIFALFCLFPIVLAISGSLSDEMAITMQGFSIIPRHFSLDTYRYVFSNLDFMILKAYKITLFTTIFGTLLSVSITACFAYVISVKDFKHRNKLAFFAYFTLLFNSGMLPWYLVTTQFFGLKDSLAALILPYSINVFNMYLLRNFFKSIPHELLESAQIDGAGHGRIFMQMMLPLAKPGLVTISLFYALQYWNDFYLPLMLNNNPELYTMQYILYKMMANIQYLAANPSGTMAGHVILPSQTIKMAITCIAIGPIILLYPFVQKYFVKGVTVGAVKG
ncbi:carbohydrate ABC transporter permease [Paenibacillus sp. FSL R5-0887]|uniref:carbohydrate ABC transporter permease n=1 Tax=Paenibacillus TaxID=44249 RepID=UPI00096D8C89|nr:carbohydrate ABC transporter permease [Paenibacillus odorifer]OMC65934.1 hypothetical protein BK121_22005 [Paenibacillus odorifer]OMC77286.1 hypothetical protein BK125_12065 [Paenibacillus odorifer]OMD98064.1 hypothetical protein BSK67_02075 [Paenibacillus odorifer]OME05543.1 hypothetical protein BSK54_00475 [Paenibacillus odorifer]OME09296.1 hypothetical protein BSK64_02085 [Paenibacillus odorifer]